MTIDIDRELLRLRRLTTAQLCQRYLEIFGEAPRSHNKTWLLKRLAWRLQALAEGDLSERARQRAAQLARDADLRLAPPRRSNRVPRTAAHHKNQAKLPVEPATTVDPRLPPPGSWLTRSYKGQTIQVKVLAQGFQYQGTVFSSLSALAKEITGSHCSGFWFFNLGRPTKEANNESQEQVAIRCAIYTRKSTEEGLQQEFNSLDAQRDAGQAYIAKAIPDFVAEIKSMFEAWKLAYFLNTPRRLGAPGHVSSEEGHRMLRESMDESERIREDARNMMLLDWAKELLLEETEP